MVKTIVERKEQAKNVNELLEHLIKLIESQDERFSFEWAIVGENIEMKIFDKEKKIGYLAKIKPIEYDKNGNVVNL